MIKTRNWALGCSLLLWIVGAASADEPNKSPISEITSATAEDSINHIQIPAGTELELVASEPQVIDPIAIRFDEFGRMWVAQMGDYPEGKGKSSIRILEDLDNDGEFETSRLFADDLHFVTGLQPWKQGVIVTMAGRVAYMKDTDGDHQADLIEDWYVGFSEDNTQLRANHPRLGLDNHVYIANGLRGGVVKDPRGKESKTVNISGMDFKFDPITAKYEAVSGAGQFGLTFDDQGNRYVCSNRNPLMQIMIANKYVKKYSSIAVADVKQDAAQAGVASKIFPLTNFWTTSNLHEGQFTAACGVLIYRGHSLIGMKGIALTCDPTGNLVHAERLSQSRAAMTYLPMYQDIEPREFLASRDSWFRAVNLRTGPDGCLYIVDMHRAVIEHPNWVPAELKMRKDTRYGDDKGRIYRLKSKGERLEARWNWNIANSGIEDLVLLLEHPNSWHRETAARLLIERRPDDAEILLSRIFIHSIHWEARQRALWVLEGLGLLQPKHIEAAVSDSSVAVRKQAAVLLEKHWDDCPHGELLARKMLVDSNQAVQFQALLSFGDRIDHADFQLWLHVFSRSIEDKWLTQAMLMAVGDDLPNLVQEFWTRGQDGILKSMSPEKTDNIYRVHHAAARYLSNDVNARQKWLTWVVQWWSEAPQRYHNLGVRNQGVTASLVGTLDGIRSRRVNVSALQTTASSEQQVQIEVLWDFAKQWADNVTLPAADRLAGIKLLGHAGKIDVLMEILAAPIRSEFHVAVLQSLQSSGSAVPWDQVLDQFSAMRPAVKRACLDAVLRQPATTLLLLDALEAKDISANEVDSIRMNRMLKHSDKTIASRATAIQGSLVNADRQAVLAKYRAALTLEAFPKRGEIVFRKNCATCHKIGEIGMQVAPDISDSRTRQPIQILTDILQPNRAIDNNYMHYSIILNDGRVLDGILATETSSSVTLRQPEGKQEVVPRLEIDEIISRGVSLMPEGLEKNITLQQMADLVSFVKNWRYLDGRIPLEKPLPKEPTE
jgi:putative membrane-bound dehydrogenase-like protein